MDLADAPVPPITNSAFLWHFVGIPDKVKHILRDFGLDAIEDTYDCDWLATRFNQIIGQSSLHDGFPECKLTGSTHVCPYEDSSLMPHTFGC